MDRRTFVRSSLGLGAGAVLGGSLWRMASAAPAPSAPAVSPYGPLQPADVNGIRLRAGFSSRIVARSGQTVPGTSYVWHGAPDGGACFPLTDGGWIYVSNSELGDGDGGVGAVRFGRDGAVADAYRILRGTNRNCAGGATPWGTWLSCEEVSGGFVYETWPEGGRAAVRRPAMGRFNHEAAAADPDRRCVYLTEDESDGCFYRFVPTSWPDLSAGRLEVLRGPGGRSAAVTWAGVPDPGGGAASTRHQVGGAKRFDGGEGCFYADGKAWFTTKGDDRVWRYDALASTVDVVYDPDLLGAAPLRGPDNIIRSAAGDLLVAEDGGNMEICLIGVGGLVSTFLRVEGQPRSEIAGPAFSPDGARLYFSSQRGRSGSADGGVTYEITGPFRTDVPPLPWPAPPGGGPPVLH